MKIHYIAHNISEEHRAYDDLSVYKRPLASVDRLRRLVRQVKTFADDT